MTPSREDALYRQVLDTPQDRRGLFLETACAGDELLKRRLIDRLASDTASDELAEQTTAMSESEIQAVSHQDSRDEAIGQVLGRYRLTDKLGEGGCGAVYVAEQTEPVRRLVAVKVIKLGMDTKQVVARFEAERQALAMMDHPNIAKVLDAGTTEAGRPFFVMELVKGSRITDFCDQANLSARDRLDLFVKVCHAIQHAHQKGIIHRDIKPSNILVASQDGVAVPKVIDFGIAKATEGRLTDETVFTQLHQFIGTPAYMSPEQAEMSGMDIDTRSDIYSLGVLLYELLTGRTPFDARELMSLGLDGMRKTILEREPDRPSTRLSALDAGELTKTAERRSTDPQGLSHLLRGDLDWIVMKCLEKDRTRRYETANGLAADITRYLNFEPVTARPASAAYKFQKAFRRNRLVFAAAGAVLLALVIGIVVSTWQARVANLARHAAEEAQLAEKEQRVAAEEARRLAEVERNRADENAARSTQVANLLKDMLASVGPSVARGRDATLLKEVLTNTVSRLDRELGDQPEVEADLRLTLGRTFRDLGDYLAATVMNRRALELRRKSPGGRHETVAQALNELSKSLNLQGNWAEAETFQREALAIRKENLRPDDLLLADMYNDLGIILWNSGKLAEAREAYRHALTIKEQRLMPPDYKLADAHLNLSALLLDLGDFAQGEAEAREALAGYRSVFGGSHPRVGMALHNQGKSLAKLDRMDAAEAALRGALAVYRQVYAADHAYIAEALDDLGQIQQQKGDRTGSEQSFRESLEMARRLLGENHPSTLTAMRHLALLKAASPVDSEAEQWIQRAVDLARQRYSKQPAVMAITFEDWGQYLVRTGRPSEALSVLLQAHQFAVDGKRSAFERQRLARQLGELYQTLGNPAESGRWLTEAGRMPAE